MSSSTIPSVRAKWFALINDEVVWAPHREVPATVLKTQAKIPQDHVLIRDHNSPNDAVMADNSRVDLSLGNVFYSRLRSQVAPRVACEAPAKLAMAIDDRPELTLLTEQSVPDLLGLFGLPSSTTLFRDYESPNDEQLEHHQAVRFPDGPVFYTQPGSIRLVAITIDNKTRYLAPGNTAVAQLKSLGGVPETNELSQIIKGKLTALADTADVCIEGGEIFSSSPRDSASS